MAFNTSAFSPKEWTIGVAEETTVGTAVTSFKGIEVESISMPSINDLRVMEKRAGSTGRVLNEDDLFYLEAGAEHEFSVGGTLTDDLIPILVENAMGVAVASDVVLVDSAHAPASFLHGASTSGSHNTVCFAIDGVSSPASSYTLKGCVIESLTISANASEDGGRYKFELTAKSRSPFESTAHASSVNTIAAYTENFIFLGDFSIDKTVFAQAVVLDTLSLAIENPVAFLGNGASGVPEAYMRSVPEFKATASCGVKFDANTAGFIDSWREQSVATPKGLYIASHATWGSSTAIGGIKMDNVIFAEQPSYDEGDFMKINCVLQSIDDESDSEILSIRVT
jgi:hypothetical protein